MSARKKAKKLVKRDPNYEYKHPKNTGTSKGYFYVRKLSQGWSLYFESYSKGRRLQTRVLPASYREFGLDKDKTTYLQAKKAIKEYNSQRKDSIGLLSQIRAMKRVELVTNFSKTFFPKDLIIAFLERLEKESDGKPPHKKKLVCHFHYAQKMVRELKLFPHEYREESGMIYSYFKQQKISASYAKCIVYVLNKWGHFYSRQQGRFFEPIGLMKPTTKSALTSEQRLKTTAVRRASLPMTPEILKQVYKKIDHKNPEELAKYNYLMISFYFGLRPKELDDVIENTVVKRFEGVPVLEVYQSKLVGLQEEDRYKRIPVIYKEQMQCLGILNKAGKSKVESRRNLICRPTAKWVDAICKQERKIYNHTEKYGLGSMRRGFTDWMLSQNQALEDISKMMGHRSIELTWNVYRTRNSVSYRPTAFVNKTFKEVG